MIWCAAQALESAMGQVFWNAGSYATGVAIDSGTPEQGTGGDRGGLQECGRGHGGSGGRAGVWGAWGREGGPGEGLLVNAKQ